MTSRMTRSITLFVALIMVATTLSFVGPAPTAEAQGESTEPGPDWEQTRLQFAHRPITSGVGEFNFRDQVDIYVNDVEIDDLETEEKFSTVRLYGEELFGGPQEYTEVSEPFDPTVIEKDSATFNAAYILHTDEDFTGRSADFSWMKGCFEIDANLKKHLRIWYEPDREFYGPRVSAGLYDPATIADDIIVESTYNLVNSGNHEPLGACESSWFPFPTEGVNIDTDGDNIFDITGHEQPGLDTMRAVHVGAVSPDDVDTADGTVELERPDVTLEKDEYIQMFDHVYRYDGVEEDFEGNMKATFTVWYAGNTQIDTPKKIKLGPERVYLSRGNNLFETPLHLDPSATRTSFIDLTEGTFSESSVTFTVGKEIRQGDIFYVDGVRYEVPSVYVAQEPSGEAALRTITLRTPLPKSDPAHDEAEGADWTSVPDEQIDVHDREVFRQRQWQVEDWSIVTTQRLVEIGYNDPIPVDPPFNHEVYRQVDDTDVQLWTFGPDRTQEECFDSDRFPWGERNPAVPDGNGLPFFPLGHTYVTMDSPPTDWIDCWDAERTDWEDLSERIVGVTEEGINWNAWTTTGGWYPIVPVQENTNFFWVKEWCEGRYNTNLYEIFHRENNGDSLSYTHFEHLSHPCQYTEFHLPDRANPFSYDTGFLDTGMHGVADANDVVFGAGDYLIMTSFRLQDGETRFAFVHEAGHAETNEDEGNYDYRGIYFSNREGTDSNTGVRLYGEEGFHAPDEYDEYWHAFDPYIIPKDSATFNPAIILHTDDDFTGRADDFSWIRGCNEIDGNLKKHLRIWYEPQHDYQGPRVGLSEWTAPTFADVVQVETTYQLVSGSSYEPLQACTSSMMPFPTEGVNFDQNGDGDFTDPGDINGHEQPGLDTMRAVHIGEIAGGGTDGIVELEREDITLVVGECLQMFDHMYCYDGIEENFEGDMEATFTAYYIGNTRPDTPTELSVGNERIYITRGMNTFPTPLHNDPDSTRTSYIDLTGGTFSETSVTFTAGKEIRQGDIFYVDGVRHDVPAVMVGCCGLEYLTLRTPLPKSDPAHGNPESADWTSVPDEQIDDLNREVFRQQQWQVEDWSIVTTQRLVQVDAFDPIPVNPPFNHETYRMVDDTDLVLWEPGPDRQLPECEDENEFPWGDRNPSVPDGNGLPFFPQGHVYISMQNPPTEWLECWDAEPTGFSELSNRVHPEEPPSEPGLNPGAWVAVGDPYPIVPQDGNFYWMKEWCDGRFNTNLLEMMNDGFTYDWLEVNSLPCKYTEFNLPDRSNPHSLIIGTLDSGKQDLIENPDLALAGGDYLITTSLLLQDPAGAGGGFGDPSGTFDAYDSNEDCVVTTSELFNAVDDWKADLIDTSTLFTTVDHWKNSDAGPPEQPYPDCTT